jgi:hypothetical protein
VVVGLRGSVPSDAIGRGVVGDVGHDRARLTSSAQISGVLDLLLAPLSITPLAFDLTPPPANQSVASLATNSVAILAQTTLTASQALTGWGESCRW